MSVRDFCIIVSTLWFFAGNFATAQTRNPADPSAIQGRVIDALTGEPLRKVRMSLQDAGSNAIPADTSSDDSGGFAMKGLDAGRYKLLAERNGYLRQEYGARVQGGAGTVFTLGPGQNLTDLVIKLTPYGVIAGRVVDEDSEPVPSAQVSVFKYAYTRGRRHLVSAGGGVTNDLGEYRIFGLASGRYVLSATARSPSDLNLTVDRTAGQARSEERYAATFFPGGSNPEAATAIDLAAGARIQGVNIVLLKTRTVRIRGRITSSIAAPANADASLTIYLLPQEGGLAGVRSTRIRDPQGNFEFRAVTPGSYSLSATYSLGDRHFSASSKLTVADTDIDNANLAITAGVDLPGSVRVEGDARVNVGSVAIVLEPKDGETQLSGISAPIGSSGSFVLPRVPAGDHDIDILGLPEDVYVKSIVMGQQNVIEAGISTSNGAAPLEIVLSSRGGTIEGVVQNEKGEPAPEVSVVLAPDVRSQFRLFKSATTDANGAFSIKGVAPADYKLFAWEGADVEAAQDPEFMMKYESSGDSASVHERERLSKQLKLIMIEGH